MLRQRDRGRLAFLFSSIDSSALFLRCGLVAGRGVQGLGGGGGEEVGLHLFPEPVGAVKESAGDHYPHVGPGVYGLYGIDKAAHAGRLFRGCAVNQEDVGRILVYEGKNVVVGKAAAEETHFPSVALEQVGDNLGPEFLNLVRRTGYDDFFTLFRVAGQFVLELVDDCAVYSRGQMLLDGCDSLDAEELLDLDHDRPYNVDVN